MYILPVIMAGGTGSRLWPLSRVQHPKQFLPLAPDGQTLLQATVRRLDGLNMAEPLLICNEEHRFLAAEQMRTMGRDGVRILLEPTGRNTAPAVALAALHACRQIEAGHETVLLVLAADHVINDVQAFHHAIAGALPMAQDGKLVTFGVVPKHAETGYGYIEEGTPIGAGFTVRCFVEKPSSLTAQAFMESGRHLWNSGMFMFTAGRYLNELERFAPDMLQACQAAMNEVSDDMSFVRVGKVPFEACPSNSIDYAVMEKTADAVVIPLDAGWSDMGSWTALWDVSAKDSSGNVLQGDVLAQNSSDNYVYASNRLVATLGVQDLVVVETKDAVLVTHKSQAQDVKKIVDQIKTLNRCEHHNHREVHRPWGVFDSIDAGKRHQVKRITVKPGAKLSVQMHHHRAEHWIVVNGTARITNGDQTYLLTENQSTYIPVGQVHALENPGKIPLELIEVQSGAYLGEDDIVRLEDRHGRI